MRFIERFYDPRRSLKVDALILHTRYMQRRRVMSVRVRSRRDRACPVCFENH